MDETWQKDEYYIEPRQQSITTAHGWRNAVLEPQMMYEKAEQKNELPITK